MTIESTLYAVAPGSPDFKLTAVATAGLIAFAAFVVVYRAFAIWIARAGGQPRASAIGRVFVLSLIPIAIAYHLAHYFSYLLIQGQRVIYLVSDPFGFGWNLFGTAGFRPDIGLVDARFTWYTAVIAIVLGHIVAVYVAHVIALRELAEPRASGSSRSPSSNHGGRDERAAIGGSVGDGCGVGGRRLRGASPLGPALRADDALGP